LNEQSVDYVHIVDVDDIILGVPAVSQGWWNWETYLSTWRIIDDAPDTPVEELPLYRTMRRHYARIDDRRLKRELVILNLPNGDRDSVARGWVCRHVELYLRIKEMGFDPDQPKRIEGHMRRDGKVWLHDGHHRVSMIKHLGEPKRIKVNIIGRR